MNHKLINNDAQIEYWNTEGGRPWVERAAAYDEMLGPFLDLVFTEAAPLPGERVLDVGCGSGALTRAMAVAVGPEGSVTGIDISAPLLALARERADFGGLDLSWVEGDAQACVFAPASFDLVVSRFGVMFFADPVAAFANIRHATRPGGRLAFCCWQHPAANGWVSVPLRALASVVPVTAELDGTAPGPFSFADRDRVESVLEAAGWVDVRAEAVLTEVAIGGAGDVDRAVEFYLHDGMGRRMLEHATEREMEAVRSALRNALAPFTHEDAVVLDASIWLVTATAG